MSGSKSGRVVIDIDPEQKQTIYAGLKERGGLTMREWFLQKAEADGLLQSTYKEEPAGNTHEGGKRG